MSLYINTAKLYKYRLISILSILIIYNIFISSPSVIAGVAAPGAGDHCHAEVSTGTSVNCSITNQPSLNDIILVHSMTYDGTGTITQNSVVDNAGSPNSFILPTGTAQTKGCDTKDTSQGGSSCVAYLIEPNGSGGKQFTMTINATHTCGYCSITVDRFHVTSGTVAFTFSAAANTANTGAINLPAITVGAANTLIWGTCTDTNSCTGVTGAWVQEASGLGTGSELSEYQLSVSSNTNVGFTGVTAYQYNATGTAFLFTAGSVTNSQLSGPTILSGPTVVH